MYDVLDQYQQPYDPLEPRVCVDEKPKQLLADTRPPIPGKPGRPAKYDYEYERKGTANIFVAVEPKAGKRTVEVTKRRTMRDFAAYIKYLMDRVYPEARKVHIILDNLSTHKDKALQDTFGEEEAARILERIEWHYTPKHGSWLNAAEIEIGVMDAQCTKGRFPDIETLSTQVQAWAQRRNRNKKSITWLFTRERADKKLGRHYV